MVPLSEGDLSRLDKLVARIKARPPEASFADVRRLLSAYGWSEVRQSGSHVVFAKDGERSITVPLLRGRKVKAAYLEQIIERLGI